MIYTCSTLLIFKGRIKKFSVVMILNIVPLGVTSNEVHEVFIPETCSKDTLESMCYILMDFYLRGGLFDPKLEKEKDFLESKNLLKTDGIPIVFLEFYEYVKNLNHKDEIKFTEWKIKFKKCIPEDEFNKPYEWVSGSAKSKSSSNDSTDNNLEKDGNAPFSFEKFIKEVFEKKSYNKLKKDKKVEPTEAAEPVENTGNNSSKDDDEETSDLDEDEHEDLTEIDEGDLGNYSRLEEKLSETNSFKFRPI